MTDLDLDALQALADAATPGMVWPEDSYAREVEADLLLRFRNAFSPTAALALIARVRAAEARVTECDRAHVCIIDCRPNKHVAFVGRTALDDLCARLDAAEKERDAAVEKWEAAKFDRNNAEKVEGLAAGLERDLRSERAKVELLAQRLDEMTLSRDKHRNRATALRDGIRALADEWESAQGLRVAIDRDGTCDGCSEWNDHLVASYPNPESEPWLCAVCDDDGRREILDLRALLASHPVKEGGE